LLTASAMRYPIPHRGMATVATSPGSIAVLHKALDILEALQSANSPRALDEIVAATGIARSTAHRLLLNLSARGYVERSPSARFALGLRLLELGANVRQKQSLRELALPIMLEIRDHFRETVNLGKLRGDSVVYLESVESAYAFRVSPVVGVTDPVHATALGKAILAWLPPERRPAISDWTRLTPKTITDPEAFDADLALTRKLGFAIDDEESMEGGRCIGVPILRNHAVVAALSISGPKARITDDRVQEMADRLKSAAEKIAAQLGLHTGGG